MKKFKIINKYQNNQLAEFYNIKDASEYLSRNQRIGKIGILKGKEVLKIKIIDTDKQRLYNVISKNRKLMKKEWFGI